MGTRVELLTPERVTELWDDLAPLFTAAAQAHDMAASDLTATALYLQSQTDKCAIFVGYEDETVGIAIAIQFIDIGGRKGADVLAMAGKRLLRFKGDFWEPILAWLKANGVEFVDATASERMAKIYLAKFGFTKSCVTVRMEL